MHLLKYIVVKMTTYENGPSYGILMKKIKIWNKILFSLVLTINWKLWRLVCCLPVNHICRLSNRGTTELNRKKFHMMFYLYVNWCQLIYCQNPPPPKMGAKNQIFARFMWCLCIYIAQNSTGHLIYNPYDRNRLAFKFVLGHLRRGDDIR